MARRTSTVLLVSTLLLFTAAAFAQAIPDTTIAAALSNLGTRSGVVFAGEVTAIRPLDGVVEIDFQITQNLKAASAGTYTLREWSGLWSAGQRRYWIGERAVVFLTPAGKSGLSSAVDGMDGILPLTPDATRTLVVDVERLRSRILRDSGAPMVDSASQMSLAQVSAVVNPPSATAPTAPIRRPSLPIAHPIVPAFPNQVFQRVQLDPILVMDPAQSDDFLSTDDVDAPHKKSEPANATH